MHFITQLADARQAEWLREADHARRATSARAARRPTRHAGPATSARAARTPVRRPARRARLAATAPDRVIRAILHRPAV